MSVADTMAAFTDNAMDIGAQLNSFIGNKVSSLRRVCFRNEAAQLTGAGQQATRTNNQLTRTGRKRQNAKGTSAAPPSPLLPSAFLFNATSDALLHCNGRLNPALDERFFECSRG